MSAKQKRRVVNLGEDEESRIQRVRDEMLQPREEDMELAAKVVIAADEQQRAETLLAEEHVRTLNHPQREPLEHGSFYEEKLKIANRRQEMRAQHAAATQEPPCVIAVPEQPPDDWWGDDLDSVSQTIPFVLAKMVEEQNKGMSAEVLDQRFEKITDMLVKLQKQQYDTFAKQHTSDTEPTASLTQSSTSDDTSRDLTSSTATSTRDPSARVAMDPPSSLDVEHKSIEQQPKPTTACRPDPPAMQMLIGEMIDKYDPTGEVQSNDLSNFVLERLTPATRRGRQHIVTPAPGQGSSELDRKLPAQPTKPDSRSSTEEQRTMTWRQALRFDAELDSKLPARTTDQDVVIENFDQQWESAERLVRSALNEETINRKAVGPPASDFSGSVEAPSVAAKQKDQGEETLKEPQHHGPTNRNVARHNEIREPGAIRVRPPTSHGAEDASSDGEHSSDIPEQQAASASSNPITAHVVDESKDLDRDLQLKKLNEAVASLQKQEARIVRAEEVVVEKEDEDEDDDDEPSFFETYGYTILMVGLAFAVGLLVGSRTRRRR